MFCLTVLASYPAPTTFFVRWSHIVHTLSGGGDLPPTGMTGTESVGGGVGASLSLSLPLGWVLEGGRPDAARDS